MEKKHMKRKNILLLTSLLLTQAPVWAMDNEDIERASANYRPAINSIRTDGDLILQASTIRNTGSLIIQSSGDLTIGTSDIRFDENSICTIIGTAMTSEGDLMLSASDIRLDNSTIKSTGNLILRAAEVITLGSNASLESKECVST